MSEHKIFLAGTNFGDRFVIRGNIPEHTPLVLRRDASNPHDKNAIEVGVSVDVIKKAKLETAELIDGCDFIKLGMIPAKRGPNWALILSKVIDGGGTVTAKFRRHQDKQIRIIVESDKLPEVI